ncbi:hypothetical protein [Herbiconiux liukaitaii]|uniref:hypothetical protein n=1 Tax=Herbiconiux liukaitaii TaxID=3342799 RepID=UPI0035BAC41C
MSKTVQELVHEQVATKIAAGEELERKVTEVTERTADLAAAEKGAATARRAALGAGWTETELKSLGLAERSRPRRRAAAPPAAPAEDDGGSEQ